MRLLLAALICSTAAAAVGDEPARPNVLVILADDLGFSDLGCYGGEIETPRIDALAAGGVRFTQCYTSARCCPSRASLLTGLHPHEAGIGSFANERNPNLKRGEAYYGQLLDDTATFAEVLRPAGYRTFAVGKWHVGDIDPTARGFEQFYGYLRGYEQDQWSPDRYVRLPEGTPPELSYAVGDFYATDVFTDYALEFLKQAEETPDQPWLLYLAHSSPHFPVQAPRDTVDKYYERYLAGWDVLRERRFGRQRASGLATDAWTLTGRSVVPVDKPMLTAGYGGKPNPAWDTLDEDRRKDLARRMAVFAAMVDHVDRGVGRLTDYLKQTGQFEDTLILFLSDNGACYEWGPFGFDGPSRRAGATLHRGEDLLAMGGPGTYHAYGSGWTNLCNTPLRLYKHFTHEGGLSSPLIAHWPKRFAARSDWERTPVHLMDIAPTLAAVAGASQPEEVRGQPPRPFSGVDLSPLFEGGEIAPRTLAFEHQKARALRDGRWKAVWSKRMPWQIAWELYDIEADRCETRDLAAEEPKVLKRLVGEWESWAKRVGAEPFVKRP